MKKLVCLVIIGLLLGLFAPMAYADDPPPQSVPNGPWVEDPQTVKLESFLTIDELGKKLQDIEARSKGRMKLEIAGDSNLGHPVYVAKFGEPDPNKVGILIQSSIHGDEQTHVITCVELAQTLATSGNKDVKDILDNLTVWIVPMMNPDGNMFEVDGKWWPQRLNNQTWDPAAFGLPADTLAPFYYGQRYGVYGYDMNRDFHPNLDFVLSPNVNHRPTATWRGSSRDAGFVVAPETRAVVALFKALRPKLFIDLHHQYPT